MSPSVKKKPKEAQRRLISVIYRSSDSVFMVIVTMQIRAYFYIMRKFF